MHADEDYLKAKIKRQAAELGEDGVKVSLRTVTTGVGGAAHAIADVARDEHADVIVVGTRGRTALAGPLLGSVTQRLLHIAPPWPSAGSTRSQPQPERLSRLVYAGLRAGTGAGVQTMRRARLGCVASLGLRTVRV